MNVTVDYFTGMILLTDFSQMASDISSLSARMGYAEYQIDGIKYDLSELSAEVQELTPEDNHVLRQQFAFYHSGNKRLTLGNLEAGDWIEDGFFPVDWRFGDWGLDGIVLHFGNWAS